MSAHPPNLDALVMGDASTAQREMLLLHVGSCAACALELHTLWQERSIFSDRNVEPLQPLPFAPVGLALRHHEDQRLPCWGALAAAMVTAVMLLQLGPAPVRVTSGSEVGGMCGASWVAVNWCESETHSQDTAASTEDHFGACLMATPG